MKKKLLLPVLLLSCLLGGITVHATETGPRCCEYELREHDTNSSWTTMKEPTCTEAGYRMQYCSLCMYAMNEEEIPALGHDWKLTSSTSPNCNQNGVNRYTCTRCNATYDENIPKTEHQWNLQTTIAPTCEIAGKNIFICNICCQTKEAPVNKLGHDYKITNTVVATCTTDGENTFICTKCNHSYKEVITKLGHDYKITNTVAATCTTDGENTFICTKCNHSYKEVITKLGHDYKITNTVAATCTTDGENTFTCSNCKNSYTDPITKLGHDYETSIILPTCTEAGYTIETCKRCNDKQRINEVSATGHDAGTWITVKEAGLGIVGSKELQCTKCNYVLDTVEIPMLMTDGVDSVFEINLGNGNSTFVIGHFGSDDLGDEVVNLVNEHRVNNGLSQLINLNRVSCDLTESATIRSIEISYSFDHIRPNGILVAYGENLLHDSFGNTNAQKAFDLWRNSSGHNENMIYYKYKTISVKIFYQRLIEKPNGDYQYASYWVQNFF